MTLPIRFSASERVGCVTTGHGAEGMREDRIAEQFRDYETFGAGPILPSRVPVLSALADAWANPGPEPRILTGAAGTGKSWLWRHAVTRTRSMRSDLRWVWVPKWPESRTPDLMRALLGALEDTGISVRMSIERSYVYAERKVREIHEDGFGLRIVIEEAHLLDRKEFDSLRIFDERLRPIGIDMAILLVGRTSLHQRYRRFTGDTRPAGWHLPHISLPETLELLEWFGGSNRSWTRSEADWIHREALGNPRRIVRWAATIPGDSPEADKPMLKPGFGYESGGKQPAVRESAILAEPLIPTRPPLAESEGVIEVGYEDDFEAPPTMTAPWLGRDEPEEPRNDPDSAETQNTISTESPERKTRYRKESGESFAPYGLGATRTENSPERPTN